MKSIGKVRFYDEISCHEKLQENDQILFLKPEQEQKEYHLQYISLEEYNHWRQTGNLVFFDGSLDAKVYSLFRNFECTRLYKSFCRSVCLSHFAVFAILRLFKGREAHIQVFSEL